MIMEQHELGRDWEQSKQKIREQYPHVREEDLHLERGKEEELLERLQEKLGKTKKEIRNWLHIMG